MVSLKYLALAFLIAFNFCFFIGIFWNHPVRIQKFSSDRWYYINRGHPVSWAGVSKPNLSDDFPIIKAPLLYDEIYKNRYAKIIDLTVFLPLFLVVTGITYLVIYVSVKIAKGDRVLERVLNVGFLILTVTGFFSISFGFPVYKKYTLN